MAASDLPFGNLGLGLATHEDGTVIVEITDHGPAKSLLRKGRIIDMSRAAFARLVDLDLGVIDVSVRRQQVVKGKRLKEASEICVLTRSRVAG